MGDSQARVTTRSTTALDHVLDNVMLDNQGNGAIRKALIAAGVRSVNDFELLMNEDIDLLEYEQDDGSTQQLSIIQKRMLKNMLAYADENELKTKDDWLVIDRKTFLKYGQRARQAQAQPQALTGSAQTVSSSADEFKKGMKRSFADYKPLSDDTKWQTWNRHLHSVAMTHGTEKVLDPEYKPVSNEDIELFAEQKKFMYTVFDRTLHTAKSLKFVRQHEKDKNAQALYEELVDAYQKGTTGHLNVDKKEDELKAMVLDSKWNKPLKSWLEKWSHTLLDLQTMKDDPISEDDKRKWLEKSIRSHDVMGGYIQQAHVIEQTFNSGKMSFDKFYEYIYSQAETLDEHNKNKRKTQSRQTNQHQRHFGNGIQPLVPQQKWSSMTKEAKIAHCKKHNIYSQTLNPQGKFLPDGRTPRRKKGSSNGNGTGNVTGTSQR